MHSNWNSNWGVGNLVHASGATQWQVALGCGLGVRIGAVMASKTAREREGGRRGRS